jgi:hypothetical protein
LPASVGRLLGFGELGFKVVGDLVGLSIAEVGTAVLVTIGFSDFVGLRVVGKLEGLEGGRVVLVLAEISLVGERETVDFLEGFEVMPSFADTNLVVGE